MTKHAPRMAPLTDEELDAEQEAMIAPLRANGADYTISRAFVRHPRALKAFNALAGHMFYLDNTTLTERQRELAAIRTAWHCRSSYEWGRHIPLGRNAGLSDQEIEALKRPIVAGNWNEGEAALIATADALLSDFFVPDDVWLQLTAHYEEQQCIDVIYTVGTYALMAMFLNTARVPLDNGFPLDPDLELTR